MSEVSPGGATSRVSSVLRRNNQPAKAKFSDFEIGNVGICKYINILWSQDSKYLDLKHQIFILCFCYASKMIQGNFPKTRSWILCCITVFNAHSSRLSLLTSSCKKQLKRSGYYECLRGSTLDIHQSETCRWCNSFQTNEPGGEKSCEGLLQAGQRVQTAFASNPAGLRSRLSKAAELPEWAEQTNPPHEQSIKR